MFSMLSISLVCLQHVQRLLLDRVNITILGPGIFGAECQAGAGVLHSCLRQCAEGACDGGVELHRMDIIAFLHCYFHHGFALKVKAPDGRGMVVLDSHRHDNRKTSGGQVQPDA